MVGIARVPVSTTGAASALIRKLHASALSRLLGTPKARLAVGVPAATAVGAVAEGTLWAHHPLVTTVNLLATALFVTTGVLLAEDQDQQGTAFALIAAGIARPLGWLDQWQTGPLPLYSVIFGYLDDIFGAWALLRYPRPRLSRGHRWFLAVLAGWLVLGPVYLSCISHPGWWGSPFRDSALWPQLWPDKPLFELSQNVFDIGAVILAGTFLFLLAGRLRSSGRRDRVILLPVVAAATLAGLAAGLVMTVAAVSHPTDELFALEGMADLTVPVAFFVSITQQRLVRMAGMFAEFDDAGPTPKLLRQVLRVYLRDADLDLLIWSRAAEAYLTVDGHRAGDTTLAAGKTAMEVSGRDGGRLAELIVDQSSARDHTLLAAATVMSRLALENALLSRRLLTADYAARQQLAADLHDGVQNKLCGLLIALSAATHAANEATRASLDQVSQRVDGALRELRALVHGVYPPELSKLGLLDAVRETARRLDLLADIDIPVHGLPPDLGKTLYFVICEALTNVHRHAHTTSAMVAVTHDGNMIKAVISDDGVGGADRGRAGLASLRDRVQAHDGVLHIDSEPGRGTRLTVRIPCA